MKGAPPKLRYVNEVVGAFVLLALGLLVVGVYVAGRAQGWFEPRLALHTVFPDQAGALGLQEGAEVRILGTLAGRVTALEPNEDGRMTAVYVIRGRFSELVRTNSVAIVKKKFEVAGDSFVEITMGDRRMPVMRTGDSIVSTEDVEVLEAAKRVLEEVRRVVIPMLEQVQNILVHVSGITGSIEEGEGTVGRLIRDPEVADRVQEIVRQVQETTARMPAAMENVKTAGDRLPAIADELSAVATEYRSLAVELRQALGQVDAQGVSVQAEATLREIQELMETLQRHWLLRKYAPAEEGSALIPPASVPAGGAREDRP